MVKLQNSSAGARVVLGAWYGDVRLGIQAKLVTGGLSANEHGDRYCAATSAVRSWCQGKTGCFAPVVPASGTPPTQYLFGDPSKDPFAAAYFCGYDPQPYADGSVKGLVIAYRCRALPSGSLGTATGDAELYRARPVSSFAGGGVGRSQARHGGRASRCFGVAGAPLQ